ncbi:hypothetical protein KO481_25510 [Nocardia sp. NEAU-G5]|uniref:Uncharacterized protein n=1 Tax=Nocardia albiluteola TaxID=2842303 RepID=A0ABS6B6R9_9NOCA|nr:hypothetical protein [Nocardia albiluteola]MBU3064874.1 hypothetical protein [Nocardia albiluteola]
MEEFDKRVRRNRRIARTVPEAERAASLQSAQEVLRRTRQDRAQLEQARLFHATLLDNAEELHEEIRLLQEELREIHRNLSGLRRRFPSLVSGAPRTVGRRTVGLESEDAQARQRGNVSA